MRCPSEGKKWNAPYREAHSPRLGAMARVLNFRCNSDVALLSRAVPCSKCHSHRLSEIALLWRERGVQYRSICVTVTPVTRIPDSPRPRCRGFSL